MDIPRYDSWKTRVPDDPPIAFYCDECGEEVFEGDEYYEVIMGDRIHLECFDSYAMKMLDPTLLVAEPKDRL